MADINAQLRELKEELLSWSGLAQAVAIVLMFSLLFVIWHQSFQAATERGMYWIEVFYVLVMTIILAVQYRNGLSAAKKRGEECRPKTSTMKLRAEIFAAVAMISFFLAFYRLGLDNDRANHEGRSTHLVAAQTYLIKPEVCASSPALMETCDRLRAGFSQAASALYKGNEGDLQTTIAAIKAEAVTVIVAKPRQSLKWVDAELDETLVKDGSRLYSMLVLNITLFFSSLAVSRKIALAWFEKNG